jgi:hypothetical protein
MGAKDAVVRLCKNIAAAARNVGGFLMENTKQAAYTWKRVGRQVVSAVAGAAARLYSLAMLGASNCGDALARFPARNPATFCAIVLSTVATLCVRGIPLLGLIAASLVLVAGVVLVMLTFLLETLFNLRIQHAIVTAS